MKAARAVGAALLVTSLLAQPTAKSRPGEVWLDTSGKPVLHRAGRQLCDRVARPSGPRPYCTVIMAFEFEDSVPIVTTTILLPDGVPVGIVTFTW